MLFDTGYAKRFTDHTSSFPEICYRWLTPMHLCDKEDLKHQLAARGIGVGEIKYIFISHFHADHIAGLLDFPDATFLCSREGLKEILYLGRLKGVLKGYLKGLLPQDIASRCQFIEDSNCVFKSIKLRDFGEVYDLFGDGSLTAIPLPGHAVGHYGLMMESNNASVFLVGDAVWSQRAYKEHIMPSRLAYLIMESRDAYIDTVNKVARFHLRSPEVQIIPSHCVAAITAFQSA